jgi:arylsulfatase A-like enzyme
MIENNRRLKSMSNHKPNVVFVFSDQHRAEAVGYEGNPDVQTPNLNRLAAESLVFKTAVSNSPVCSPYRATLMTGQYPLTHGVFVNDVPIASCAVSLGEAFKQAGYDTAYIGKWHIDGHGRTVFIPKDRRKGFDYWKVMECCHNYNNSTYYGDEEQLLTWGGYDAAAQAQDAEQYIRCRNKDKPLFMVLSWGPPHSPYNTAPQPFRDMYDPAKLILRPNVPANCEVQSRQDLAGYYAHISALDSLIGNLADTLEQEGMAENTIFIYTSDHGDMIGSQGMVKKQAPWDESIRVPFLLRYPERFGASSRQIDKPFNSPDIMPTLLGLCGVAIPDTVEGINYAPYLLGEESFDHVNEALIQCTHPFGEWTRSRGGKEYRGIRTSRYTYARDLNGPWLLYDNRQDPYQLVNLCNLQEYAELQQQLDDRLQALLKQRGDEFLSSDVYCQRRGYVLKDNGTVQSIV